MMAFVQRNGVREAVKDVMHYIAERCLAMDERRYDEFLDELVAEIDREKDLSAWEDEDE